MEHIWKSTTRPEGKIPNKILKATKGSKKIPYEDKTVHYLVGF